jgi:hypothetical protein
LLGTPILITLDIEPSAFLTFVDYALIPVLVPKSGSSLLALARDYKNLFSLISSR